MALSHRLFRAGLWITIGKIAAGLSGFMLGVVVARSLPTQEFGAFLLSMSIVTFGATMATVGLNRVMVRFVAESRIRQELGRAKWIVLSATAVVLTGGIIASVALVLVGDDLFRVRPSATVALVGSTGILALWLVPMALLMLFAEVFRALNDMRGASFCDGMGASGFALFLVGIAAAIQSDLSLRSVLWMVLAGSATTLVIAAIGLWRHLGSVSVIVFPVVREMLRVAIPLLITTAMALVLAQADIWILGFARGSTEVAVYGAAARLMGPVVLPLLIINATIQPTIVELFSHSRFEELERLLGVTAALAGIPVMLFVVISLIAGGPILGGLYGDGYESGAFVLGTLAIGQAVNVWTGSCGVVLMLTGHHRTLMNITFLSGVIVIVLGVALAGPFGMEGVAVASSVGVSIQNLLAWRAVRVRLQLRTNLRLELLPQIGKVARELLRQWRARQERVG